jgi:hypothetical protein
MAYRLAGRSTELCSHRTPCPCAFGQAPSGGWCEGIFAFDIEWEGLVSDGDGPIDHHPNTVPPFT